MKYSITFYKKNFEDPMTIDEFESLIWTERYNAYGDFEICIPLDNSDISKRLIEVDENDRSIWMDGYASIDDSSNLMFLEQFKIDYTSEDGMKMIITGRSLETILMRRIVWGLKVINGGLQNAFKSILTDCFINPENPKRKINNFVFLDSEDERITSMNLTTQFTGDNVYDIISSICQEKNLGFKINVNDNLEFVFSLYLGEDRSYDQSVNPYVIFSPENENLLGSDFIESNAFSKNCSLIGGEGEGVERRYAEIDCDLTGLDRRELFTDARDISSNCGGFILLDSEPEDWNENYMYCYINIGTEDDPIYDPVESDSAPLWQENTYYIYDGSIVMSEAEYYDTLVQRGKEDLEEYKFVKGFDGEIDPFSIYEFGSDFFIGDIVEISDGIGHESKTIVLELIRSIDQNGYLIYPTFLLMEDEDDSN